MDSEFLNIAAETFNVSPGQLDQFSTSETVQGWDSLTHWMLVGRIEEAFGVEFTMDEATEFKNLGDIYSILLAKIM